MKLVIGGTGTVGSQVVLGLIARGQQVRVATRSAEKTAAMPSEVDAVVADLTQPDTLPPLFKGVDGVFLLNALSEDETQQGLNAVRAAVAAEVGRIVYMSVVMPEGSDRIPHFASKLPIEDAIRRSALPFTILRPNNFFQNDYFFREAIVAYGVYPQPIGGAGLNRVDVRDIADAAVAALLDEGHDGRTVDLHGPDVLTGESTAAVYARHLGRPIRYAGDDLDAWAQQAGAVLPAWLVHDFKIMYAFFQERGLRATPEALATQRRLVGHDPRSFDAFVADLAPHWRV